MTTAIATRRPHSHFWKGLLASGRQNREGQSRGQVCRQAHRRGVRAETSGSSEGGMQLVGQGMGEVLWEGWTLGLQMQVLRGFSFGSQGWGLRMRSLGTGKS